MLVCTYLQSSIPAGSLCYCLCRSKAIQRAFSCAFRRRFQQTHRVHQAASALTKEDCEINGQQRAVNVLA